jgi:hypothetical protein
LVFTEIERQKNSTPCPYLLAFSLLIDEFKLGQVVNGPPCQGLYHMKPKSFSITEKRKVYERKIMNKTGKVNRTITVSAQGRAYQMTM